MKILLPGMLILLLAAACSTQKTVVHVPANQRVEIDYPNHERFQASLKNRSNRGVEVAVLSKADDDPVKGFGLGPRGSADVVVESPNKLIFKNAGTTGVTLRVAVSEAPKPTPRRGAYVSFTLRNKSLKSIPLLIPSVMNPNLSPVSNSGVSLKMGQEILFRANGKKYVLLTVDSSIREGDVVEVSTLLKARKKALGLQ